MTAFERLPVAEFQWGLVGFPSSQLKKLLPVIHGDDGNKARMLVAWAHFRRLPAWSEVTQGNHRRAPSKARWRRPWVEPMLGPDSPITVHHCSSPANCSLTFHSNQVRTFWNWVVMFAGGAQ